MRDLINDLKIFFEFLSWDYIRTFRKDPKMSFGLVILWGAGTIRDISRLGLKSHEV